MLYSIVLTSIAVSMAIIAAYILVKSRIAFKSIAVKGKQAEIEFQHAVAAVAVVFCICNIPPTVVYWWRAIILPRPLSEVPESVRQVQVQCLTYAIKLRFRRISFS